MSQPFNCIYVSIYSVFLCMRSVLSTGNEEGESSTIPDVGSSRNQAEDNSLSKFLV